MAASIELSPWFGLVVLQFVASALLHYAWMAKNVGAARKKYSVFYPTMYAAGDSKEAKTFNCIQRAHQNSLEMWPAHTILTLLVGLRFPLLAALTGAVYQVFRVIYFRGYSTGEPKARLRGSGYYFAIFAQLGLALVFAAQLLLGRA